MSIINKFKRSLYLKEIETDVGVLEFDFLLNNWDLMEIKGPISFDTIQYGDIQRPDILSYRIYGSVNYWWVLCKINHIDDIWNDMEVGGEIIVPSVSDINTFYSKSISRKRRE